MNTRFSHLSGILVLLLFIACSDRAQPIDSGSSTDSSAIISSQQAPIIERGQSTNQQTLHPSEDLISERNDEVVSPHSPVRSSTNITSVVTNTDWDRVAFYDHFRKPAQVFSGSPRSDLQILTEGGTKITIPAHSIVSESGFAPFGNIEIRIEEYTNKADALLANLTTTSQGRLLESAGMLHIAAFDQQGRECKLKKGAEIDLEFPLEESMQAEVELFLGIREEEAIDWIMPRPTIDTLWINKAFPAYEIRSTVKQQSNGTIDRSEFNALRDYLDQGFPYPELARQAGLTGKVVASVKTNWDGRIQTIEISNNAHQILEEAVVRILEEYEGTIRFWNPQSTEISGKLEIVCSFAGVGDELIPQNKGEFLTYRKTQASLPTSVSTTVESQRLVLRSPGLGWINCDRFYNDPRPKQDLIVSVDPHTDIKLIFMDINSIMAPTFGTSNATFPNLPTGAPIAMCAVKSVDSQLYVSFTTGRVGHGEEPELDFHPCTKEDFEETVKQLVVQAS